MLRFLWLMWLIGGISACHPAEKEREGTSRADSVRSAITALDKEIGRKGTNPDLFARRAMLLIEESQMEKAISDLNKAISLDNRNAEYYIILSDVYLLMGQPQKCSESLDKALSIRSDSGKALLKKAKLNLILRDYRKTFETIRLLLELDQYNPPAYYLRAIALLETGDTSAAINELMKAAGQDQQYYDAYMQLAELYALRKDPLTESYLKNALNIRPGSREALYMLGMYYQETEQFEKAISTYGNLAATDTTLATAPFNTGYIYLVFLKDFPTAVGFFTKALQRDSSYFEAWYNRGLAYELMNDYQKAESDYRMALKKQINYDKAVEGLNRLDAVRSGN